MLMLLLLHVRGRRIVAEMSERVVFWGGKL